MLQELLESQVGMTLDSMHTHMAQNPAPLEEHSLPGAHMPIKGFYFTKNLLVATPKSSPKAPSGRLSSCFPRLTKPPMVETMAHASPTVFATGTEPDVDGAGRG